MSGSPDKDELMPLRRSTRKSVVLKCEDQVLTPKKRKSTATPLKNDLALETVGTPRRTRGTATPRKSVADQPLNTPQKVTTHCDETPSKKKSSDISPIAAKETRRTPRKSTVVDTSPTAIDSKVSNKRTPRKSAYAEVSPNNLRETTKRTPRKSLKTIKESVQSEESSSEKDKDKESPVATRGKRKSVAVALVNKTNSSSEDLKVTDLDQNLYSEPKKKSRKSVHFKKEVEKHQLEKPESFSPKKTEHISEQIRESTKALFPRVVLERCEVHLKEANLPESVIQEDNTKFGGTAKQFETQMPTEASADIFTGESSLLSPQKFLESDDDGSTTGMCDTTIHPDEESLSNQENYKSPRRKLSYDKLIENTSNKSGMAHKLVDSESSSEGPSMESNECNINSNTNGCNSDSKTSLTVASDQKSSGAENSEQQEQKINSHETDFRLKMENKEKNNENSIVSDSHCAESANSPSAEMKSDEGLELIPDENSLKTNPASQARLVLSEEIVTNSNSEANNSDRNVSLSEVVNQKSSKTEALEQQEINLHETDLSLQMEKNNENIIVTDNHSAKSANSPLAKIKRDDGSELIPGENSLKTNPVSQAAKVISEESVTNRNSEANSDRNISPSELGNQKSSTTEALEKQEINLHVSDNHSTESANSPSAEMKSDEGSEVIPGENFLEPEVSCDDSPVINEESVTNSNSEANNINRNVAPSELVNQKSSPTKASELLELNFNRTDFRLQMENNENIIVTDNHPADSANSTSSEMKSNEGSELIPGEKTKTVSQTTPVIIEESVNNSDKNVSLSELVNQKSSKTEASELNERETDFRLQSESDEKYNEIDVVSDAHPAKSADSSLIEVKPNKSEAEESDKNSYADIINGDINISQTEVVNQKPPETEGSELHEQEINVPETDFRLQCANDKKNCENVIVSDTHSAESAKCFLVDVKENKSDSIPAHNFREQEASCHGSVVLNEESDKNCNTDTNYGDMSVNGQDISEAEVNIQETCLDSSGLAAKSGHIRIGNNHNDIMSENSLKSEDIINSSKLCNNGEIINKSMNSGTIVNSSKFEGSTDLHSNNVNENNPFEAKLDCSTDQEHNLVNLGKEDTVEEVCENNSAMKLQLSNIELGESKNVILEEEADLHLPITENDSNSKMFWKGESPFDSSNPLIKTNSSEIITGDVDAPDPSVPKNGSSSMYDKKTNTSYNNQPENFNLEAVPECENNFDSVNHEVDPIIRRDSSAKTSENLEGPKMSLPKIHSDLVPSKSENNRISSKEGSITDVKDPTDSNIDFFNSDPEDPVTVNGITSEIAVSDLYSTNESKNSTGTINEFEETSTDHKEGISTPLEIFTANNETLNAPSVAKQIKKDNEREKEVKNSLLGKRQNQNDSGLDKKDSNVKKKIKSEEKNLIREESLKGFSKSDSGTSKQLLKGSLVGKNFVEDFLDLEAEEEEESDTADHEEQSSNSDSEIKSVFDLFETEAKEITKTCHIGSVDEIFKRSIINNNSIDDEDDDCEWVPPSKRANRTENSGKKENRKRLVATKVMISKLSKNKDLLHGSNKKTVFAVARQKNKELKLKSTLSNTNPLLYTKCGAFTVCTNPQESNKEENIIQRSLNDEHSEELTVSKNYVPDFVTTRNKKEVKQKTTLTKKSNSACSSIDKKHPVEYVSSRDDSLELSLVAVLPCRVNEAEIKKIFNKIGINDVVSVEYKNPTTAILKFSEKKSLKRATNLYGLISYKGKPIYLLETKTL